MDSFHALSNRQSELWHDRASVTDFMQLWTLSSGRANIFHFFSIPAWEHRDISGIWANIPTSGTEWSAAEGLLAKLEEKPPHYGPLTMYHLPLTRNHHPEKGREARANGSRLKFASTATRGKWRLPISIRLISESTFLVDWVPKRRERSRGKSWTGKGEVIKDLDGSE